MRYLGIKPAKPRVGVFDFTGCEVRKIVAFTEKPDLEVAQRYLSQGGYCWNSGQFAWKADAILKEIDTHLPAATALLTQIGEAWDTPSRQQVLDDVFPRMPKGSIDYKLMQKTHNACSILLPCSWEDMGTHAALAGRIGRQHDGNFVIGKAVIQGVENLILANTDQHIVVAADNLQVVVTDDAVFVGDRSTDMKALVELVARQAPEIA